jgi:CheY-like chemotaxis protein
MNKDVIILIAEDDEGHFALIKKNLVRAGIFNEVVRFADGQEVLDFLFSKSRPPAEPRAYLLLLDIRMPKVDGVTVLERLKADEILKRVPVIILTTTDDPREVEHCHGLGCSIYVVKPVEYEDFVEAIRKVGLFLSIVSIPKIGESDLAE